MFRTDRSYGVEDGGSRTEGRKGKVMESRKGRDRRGDRARERGMSKVYGGRGGYEGWRRMSRRRMTVEALAPRVSAWGGKQRVCVSLGIKDHLFSREALSLRERRTSGEVAVLFCPNKRACEAW